MATSPEAPHDDIARLRVPPHSIEAEQGVLGALLLDNTMFARISEVLAGPDFFRHEHRLIFEAIAAMLAERKPADIITVHEHLEAAVAPETGGLQYLSALTQSIPSAANIVRHAEIVRERALLRRVIATADEVVSRAFRIEPVGELLDSAKVAFGQLEQERGPSASKRVPLLNLQQLRESSASVRWVVKNILPAESVGMLFGASGTFKSFIALDCALHVAHGLPWMGRRTTQGPVIYIAAEGGSGLWKRIAAWHRTRRIHWQDVPFYVVPVALDLGADAWRIVEAAQLLGVSPSMVVVDTLSQTYAGEENSAAEMASYFRELGTRFRQLWQCAVMLLHHTGHQATERPRGSSAIRANLDWMYGVFRDEQEMMATLTCVKQKESEPFQDANFQLTSHDLGTDEDGDHVSSLVARHLSSADEVRDALSGEQRAGRGGHNQLLLRMVQNGMRESELRTLFYAECGIETADGRRQAYHRARSWATKSGLMELAQGVVITLKRED